MPTKRANTKKYKGFEYVIDKNDQQSPGIIAEMLVVSFTRNGIKWKVEADMDMSLGGDLDSRDPKTSIARQASLYEVSGPEGRKYAVIVAMMVDQDVWSCMLVGDKLFDSPVEAKSVFNHESEKISKAMSRFELRDGARLDDEEVPPPPKDVYKKTSGKSSPAIKLSDEEKERLKKLFGWRDGVDGRDDGAAA